MHGDCEITVSFEILAEPKPEESGTQTKVSLRAVLNRPGSNMVTHHRRVVPKQGTQFFTWLTLVNEASGKNEQKMGFLPTSARTGKLRLVRTGPNIASYVAEGAGDVFTLLKEYPFASEDLKNIAIVASTGGPEAALDVRFTDLLIRSESLPDVSGLSAPAFDAPKGSLAGGLLIGLIIILLLALGLWLIVRKRNA